MKHRRYGHGRQAPLRRRQTRAASLSGAWASLAGRLKGESWASLAGRLKGESWASLAGRLKGESWASLRAGRPAQDRLRRASPVSPLCPPRVSCVSYVPLCLLYGPCVPCLLCVSSVSLVRVTTRRRRCEESDAAVPRYYPILRCRGTHRCPSRVVRRNDRLRRSGDSRKTTCVSPVCPQERRFEEDDALMEEVAALDAMQVGTRAGPLRRPFRPCVACASPVCLFRV